MRFILRQLQRLYPRTFRERFGDEMLETSRAIEHARGWRGRLGLVADALRQSIAVRVEDRAERRRHETPRNGGRMDTWYRDIAFAWRGLCRDPFFTGFVVITLALAIGANAALFGIADRLLLRGPEHVLDASRVMRVYATTEPAGMQPFTTPWFGYVSVDVFRRGATSVEGVATYTVHDGTTGRGAEARPIRVGYASPNFFRLLGTAPAAGQWPAESSTDRSEGTQEPGVILSDGAWQRGYSGSFDVIGKTVVVDDVAYPVTGVAPRGFTGVELESVDVWLPMDIVNRRSTNDWQTSWNAQWLKIVVRLKPGVSPVAVSDELTALHRAAYSGNDAATANAAFLVAPLSAGESGTDTMQMRVVRWLAGVALLIFLLACANVMNLLVARGSKRTREISVRLALGASRTRVVRTLLVETLMLSSAGAAIGLGLAYVVGSLARQSLLSTIDWPSSPIDARVLGLTAIAAVIAALVVGLVPALGVSRVSPGGALRATIRDGGGSRQTLRATLTILQATVSVALLIGAGLFVRSLWNARHLPLGFDADRVLVVEVTRPSLSEIPEGPSRESERRRRRVFLGTVLDDIGRLPGVAHASVAVGLPFGNRFSLSMRVPGREPLPAPRAGGYGLSAVSADYFATMGTRIERGRAFTVADREGSAPVAIVSALMARTVWPGENPIGQCIEFRIGQPTPGCSTIVGIAEDTLRSRLTEVPSMHVYIPLGQELSLGFGGAVLLVRGGDDPHGLEPAVHQRLMMIDSTVTFVSAETIQDRIDPQLQSWKLGATIFVWSGLLALVVSGVGIYSVLAYLVADRRHEIGVRIALGASTAHVAGIVFRWSVGMAVVGVAAGFIAAAFTAPLVNPLLFNLSARDPLTYACVAGTLVAIAIAASLPPALRASRVDPLDALKAD